MKHYDIYIDGSHLDKQNNGRLGVGGVIVDYNTPGSSLGKVLDQFAVHLKPDYMLKRFGANKPSNPSAELTAVLVALEKFGPLLRAAQCTITFHADYLGVKEWMTGKWKTKEPYIAKIKSTILDEIKKQGLDGRIDYNWVPGHKVYDGKNHNIYWNNYVDQLAKGQNG